MTATREAKPNKHLQALFDKYPDFKTRFEQEKGERITRFMNTWANLHAKDPAKAFAFMDLIEQEQATRGAAASV